MAETLNFVVLTFQGLYLIFADLFGFGWGLIALSIFSSLLFAPLERWALRLKNDELTIQKVLQPQLQEIKEKWSGQEAWSATRRLYNRYSYHPLKAIRTAAFPLLQLPILFLAYVALSSMESLKGVSFSAVTDLSQPDHLLFGFALLPFVMTAVNIAITFIGSFSKREQIQAIVIALFFLVLLYPAPAALLIYWTMNNVIGLIKAIGSKIKKPIVNIDLFDRLKKAPAWVWTLPLCPFVPTLFLWANNVSYYPLKSILFSMLVIAIGSVFSWLVLYKSFCYCHKYNKLVHYVCLCILYPALIGFVISALSYSTIRASFYDYRLYVVLAVPIAVIIICKLIGFKLLNYLLIFQILLSSSLFCYNYSKEQMNLFYDEHHALTQIKFIRKPNIYYFLCESYQNLDYVKKVFGVDSSSFIDFLKQKEFLVYDNIYSNSSYTFGTLLNIFTMRELTSEGKLSLDASIKERQIVAGGSGNNLLQILKNNGYDTAFYLKGNSYFFSHKGNLLDYTDVSFSWINLFEPLKDTNISLFTWIDTIVSLIVKKTNFSEQDSAKILTNFLDMVKFSNRPYFFAHRLQQTNHTDPYTYNYQKRQTFIESMFYQNGIIAGNKEIEKIVEIIDKRDPNSIVIFLGDHGAWTFRGFTLNTDIASLTRELEKENISLEMFIDDLFYIFAAVKLPSYMHPLTQFSPANIFSQLFNQLRIPSSSPLVLAPNCLRLDPQGKNVICNP